MSDLVVERCDPREREAEIKALFARNGQAQFDAVFERAYRPRAACGLRSWIGRIDDAAVMHISVTPLPFNAGERTLMGGVLGDLMVDEPQRDFWGPVKLLRTVVADLKRDRSIDFLLTTTTSDAEPVFKAGGFKPFGTLRRYVLPLRWPYLGYARLRSRALRAQGSEAALDNGSRAEVISSMACPGHWRPRTGVEYYDTRLPREEFSDGTWLSVTRRKRETGWAMVSRNGKFHELGLADIFWNGQEAGLRQVVHGAARYAARHGYPRLCVTTLQESRVAAQLKHAGFFPRAVRSTLLLQRIGAESPPPIDDWFLPGFALSSW